jgi:hypothetical protein
MWFPAPTVKVTILGYELLFKVGDDPLQELTELDRFYKWTYRISQLKGLFEKKRSVSPIIIYIVMVSLSISLGAIGVLTYLHFFS